MRNIAAISLGFALALVVALPASSQTRELGASGELLDGIAALVNDGVVLKSDVMTRIPIATDNFIQQQLQLPPEQRSQLPPVSAFEQGVLDQLILEEIQYQRSAQLGIFIGDDDLNSVLSEYAGSVGVTLNEFPQWLNQQGIDYVLFREQQRRDLAIGALERAEVVNRIAINPRELEQCLIQSRQSQADEYEFNISHLLISIPTNATPDQLAEAERTIREVERRLEDGDDFAELAVEYSDSQTALEGGSLGWRKGAALPTFFANDIRLLEPGEYSTTIWETGGFHVFRLNDMRGAEPLLVDQIRIRHILLMPTEILDEEATEQRLIGIREQLLEGDDFGTVAAAVSDDAVSSVDGGDLGWSVLEDFEPAFSEQVGDLEAGVLTEPFQSPYGWHIAEVLDRRSYDMTEDLRETTCRNQIGNRKIAEELDIWRRRMLDDAYVLKRL